MKKKIVNGILLVAMLFAATSTFVSCKDTDSDYKAEMDSKYASLEKKYAELQNLINGIKQCSCDPTIATRLAQVEAAINGLPNFADFVKTGDLDSKVKAMLTDYYTKAQVDALLAEYAKKGEIPAAGLTEDQAKALITAALDGYAKKTDIPTVPTVLTQQEIQALIDAAIAKIKIPEPTTGISEDKVKELIQEALKNYKPALPEIITKEEIIQIIKESIELLNSVVYTVYMTEVTSIEVDKVVNPLFSFISPFGVESNVLMAYFGDKAKRDLYFPRGAQEPIVWKGDYFLEGTGNAGKLYVTVNPSSVNFTGKTLKLMTTGGEEAPVELTPLEASNFDLKFLTRGENAFYECFATIPEGKIAKAYTSWEPKDMEAFKEQIKTLLKSRDKVEIAEMMKTLFNLVTDNEIPAYRLQAAWGEKNDMFTYSKANIAAIAVKPLTFAFDLADAAQYDGQAISALEKFEEKVVVWGTKSESAQSKIWRFLNKANIGAEKLLNNINWALQPTMLVATDTEVSHPQIFEDNNFTRFEPGEVRLMPTSWTAEIFAPAFKKYVAVVELDGQPVKADDAVNAGLMGKVIPGNVNEIPFTIESGKTYKIQYSAVDFEGNIKTLYYVIKGNKVY